MALSFASATGNLFNRLGVIAGLIENLGSYQQTQLQALTNTSTGCVAQFDTESDIQALFGSSYIGLVSGDGGYGGLAQQAAAATINRMVFRDNPQLNQTLTQANTLASIYEVIRQMNQQGATVLAMTIAATPQTSNSPGPHFTGVGNAVINCSTKRGYDGKVMENAFQEYIELTCSGDSYNGSATAGNEPLSITGTGNQTNLFAFNWPLGSNCQTSCNAINGNANNSFGNLLYYSGMNSWTGGVPTNWVLEVGTAGTDLVQVNSPVYDGTSCAAIMGKGTTNFSLTQTFNLSTGTNAQLNPQTQYSVCCFMRRDGSVPASGILTIDLCDSGGATIADQAGVANSFTVDLTSLTTSFAPITGVFRTPVIMPSTQKIRARLTTAFTNGSIAYLDKLSMGTMTKCYVSGPSVAVHAGSIPLAINDYGYFSVTNSRGSGGTLNTWQTAFARLFSNLVFSNEILLPSSSSPSISDALIAAG